MSKIDELQSLEAALREADTPVTHPRDSGCEGLARLGSLLACVAYFSLWRRLYREAKAAARVRSPNEREVSLRYNVYAIAKQRYVDLYLFMLGWDRMPVPYAQYFPNEPLVLDDEPVLVVDLPGRALVLWGVRIDLGRREQLLFAFAAVAVRAGSAVPAEDLEQIMTTLGFVPMRGNVNGISNLNVLLSRMRQEMKAGLAGRLQPMPDLNALLHLAAEPSASTRRSVREKKDCLQLNLHPDLVEVIELKPDLVEK